MKCDSCGRDFGNDESLRQHMLDKHGVGTTRHDIKERKRLEKRHSEALVFEKKQKTRRMKRIGVLFVAAAAVAGIVFFAASAAPKGLSGLGPPGSTHIHQDFKLYLDGRELDFSQQRYQLRSRHVHVEGGDGDVIHVHATGATLGFFLDTLGFQFNSSCIVADDSARYCNSGSSTLKLYVNGRPSAEFGGYVLQPNDKILISYGSESGEEIGRQLLSVTDKASITTGHRG